VGDPRRRAVDRALQARLYVRHPNETHNPLETHAATAIWDGPNLTLYESAQGVVNLRGVLAQMFGLPVENVRVVTKFVGSGFGGKLFPWTHCPLAAAAARQVGSPVRLVLSRKMMFHTVGHRPRTQQRVRIGATREGKLLSLQHDYIYQTSMLDAHHEDCGEATPFHYSVPNLRVTFGRAKTRLAPLLEEAGVLKQGSEVVFYGADRGTVTIRDNSGIVSGGRTGTVEPDPDGGFDLTVTEQFARSMSIQEALNPDNLLCYEMNGKPLPLANGFPVRLIAPGWYGVANVKWLKRIQVMDHRYAGRFMARDYVTIREQQRAGETVWTFTTVSHDRLKSAPAKVTRRDFRHTIKGAAWGAPIAAVQVQIDHGPWKTARLYGPPWQGKPRRFAWRFWTFDWGTPVPGEHEITSRAFDVDGNIQPAPDNPFLASRRTYWESNGHITRRILIS